MQHNKAVDSCIKKISEAYGMEIRTHDNNNDNACCVYYIHCKEHKKVKIGITNDPVRRLRELQNASAEELEIRNLIWFKTMNDAHNAEKLLHAKFRYYRKRPSVSTKPTEWFDDIILPELLEKYKNADDMSKLKPMKKPTLSSGVTPEYAKKAAALSVHLREGKEEKARLEWINGRLWYAG